ncbi:MAG: hypothetical protein ACLFRD_06255 [Nitriliruptoraceae bacterium]
MSFTQLIEVDGVDDPQALHQLMADWDSKEKGRAPGYLGCRVLGDQERPGHYLIEVDFSSQEEAKRNNQRPETEAWASNLKQVIRGEPTYRDLEQVCTTYP